MIYALTRRLSQARGIEDLARDSHAHWVRLGEPTLVWNKAGNIAAFDRKAQRADISVESIQGHEPNAELYPSRTGFPANCTSDLS